MNPANILALGAFFGIFMLGMLALTVRNMFIDGSAKLIKERVTQVTAQQNVAQTVQILSSTADLFHRRHDHHGLIYNWLAARIVRIRSISGQLGVYLLGGAFAIGILLALLMAALTALPLWTLPLELIELPLMLTYFVYQYLIGRFRTRFLQTFPDTIDLIVRAVRAGIPAVQAISVAGLDADEPVRSEFRLMGDRLRLGVDMKEVLDAAVERIQIADFSFFSVCLLLQRETGGALTETLENLATIIRGRRDIRLKIRALTGEGRIVSKIISILPIFLLGIMYFANPEYVGVLFRTAAGRKLLMIAAGLLVMGTVLIRKIANLDTAR